MVVRDDPPEPGTPRSGSGPTYEEYRHRSRTLAKNRAVIWVIVGVAFAWAMWGTGFGVLTLIQGLATSTKFIVTDLLPPELDGAGEFVGPALDTLYMSYIGMVMSVILSIPLGILAARNTTVHIVVAYISKALVAFIRAVPELVLAIFLVAVFGIGPLAGTIAMGVGGVGILAKAYADGIAAIDMQQVEGIKAAGGTRLQTLVQGVWPQFKPSFVTWSLYRLDLNIREASVLGLVGAGGLGYSLQQAIALFQFRTATTIILMIFVMVMLVELVTGMLRRRAI